MSGCIIHGDALEELRKLPDHSIDAIVSDPPSSISFMGASWDSDKGGRTQWIAWLAEIMTEARRVVKPGGHALIWALPRTSHWTATAIEDAGFEIRDVIHHMYSADTALQGFLASLSEEQQDAFLRLIDSQSSSVLYHLFGSGFPKSHDISKAIDRMAYPDTDRPSTNAKGTQGAMFGSAKTLDSYRDITAPATEPAKRYAGFGTALKPAVEEWILARAPLAESTIAGNVLAWGTGGLNIDATRIATSEVKSADRPRNGGLWHSNGQDSTRHAGSGTGNALGRWPANVLLSHAPTCTDEQCNDECPVRLLDEQSGTRKSGARIDRKGESLNNHGIYNPAKRTKDVVYEASEGTASRYFAQFRPDADDVAPYYYTGKASKRERNAGLDALPASAVPMDGAGIGEGKDPDAPVIERNTHPTVKSLQLMKYLCSLICPPNGIVLDMFVGSGSTLCAAVQCGFDYIGIEECEEYVAIARARIAHAVQRLKG